MGVCLLKKASSHWKNWDFFAKSKYFSLTGKNNIRISHWTLNASTLILVIRMFRYFYRWYKSSKTHFRRKECLRYKWVFLVFRISKFEPHESLGRRKKTQRNRNVWNFPRVSNNIFSRYFQQFHQCAFRKTADKKTISPFTILSVFLPQKGVSGTLCPTLVQKHLFNWGL